MYCQINSDDLYDKNGDPLTALGYYFRDLNKTNRLTAKEEAKLFHRYIANGDTNALDTVIEAHLPFVVMLATRMAMRYASYGITGVLLDDLISSGNVGLIEAGPLFDPGLGFRFSTFAKDHIRKSIRKAVRDSSKIIRLPSNILVMMAALKRIFPDIHWGSGDPIPIKQLTEVVYEKTLTSYVAKHGAPPKGSFKKNIQWNVFYACEQLSYNGQPSRFAFDDQVLLDSNYLNRVESPEEKAASSELFDLVQTFIDAIPPLHGSILRRYLGLAGTNPETPAEIAVAFELDPGTVSRLVWNYLNELKKLLTIRDTFSMYSLNALVNLFNTTPHGHPQRKNVLIEITQRKIPLLFGSYGLVRHRNDTDLSTHYVLSPNNVLLSYNGRQKKIPFGSIDDISISQTDTEDRIRVYLLEDRPPESNSCINVSTILDELNIYNNSPSTITKRKLLEKFRSPGYFALYYETIGVHRGSNGAIRLITKDVFRKMFRQVLQVKKIHAELLETGLLKISIVPTAHFSFKKEGWRC